jgi:hypothetical protein
LSIALRIWLSCCIWVMLSGIMPTATPRRWVGRLRGQRRRDPFLRSKWPPGLRRRWTSFGLYGELL